ncbi:MAG: helix-turn-helix domain-containing protein [Candidatus Methanospirare jalkutatii]|nr:helix-turn-helix domain-containing protein [Candidatus Methanospirare jalkutatii]
MEESQDIEFKEKWRDENLKTLCAFANGNGGVLFLGIRDDGTPVGVENPEELLETLPNKIRNNLRVVPDIKLETLEGKKVIRIEIKSYEIPVSYRGRFYVRSGSTTQEISDYDLAKIIMKMKKLQISWDSLPSEAGIEELDEVTVEKFKEMAQERLAISEKDSPQKILENLELMKDGKLTNAAVLLFGKNPQKYFLNSISRVGKFKSPTEVVDTIIIKGNLFEQVEALVNAIKKHINVRYVIEDIHRKDVWDYPLPAIREACINALIHRDYTNPTETEIQIKIYDDHIKFWNPGKLPEGITIEDLKREHVSRPRNKLLAMVFYYAGLIERWGTGTTRIVSLCKEHGLPEPEFKEEFGGFTVELWKDIYNEERLRKLGLYERQIKAVLYVKKRGKITNKEYQNITGVKKRQATEDLRHLEKLGILERVGTTGKGVHYVLKGHKRGERGSNGARKEQKDLKMMQKMMQKEDRK